MITDWKNTKTFKQHMAEMENFRRAHAHLTPGKLISCSGTVQTRIPGNPPCPAGSVNRFTDDTGKKIVVPICDIEMPKGTQN